MVASATKLITCRRCQRIRPHHAHGNCHGCYVSARRECDDRCDPPVNFDRVDRLALAWMMFCRGDKDETVAVACGVCLDVAREYRKEMPKWWEREYRINRISPLGHTEGRVMKTEAAKAAQRTRRVALARFLLRRGPLEFKAIIEGMGVNHNSLANDLRCEWFERTVPGYRLSPWRVTDAGRVALKGMRKVWVETAEGVVAFPKVKKDSNTKLSRDAGAACRNRVYVVLEKRGPMTLSQLAEALSHEAEYIRVAIRHSAGWFELTAQTRGAPYTITPKGRAEFAKLHNGKPLAGGTAKRRKLVTA